MSRKNTPVVKTAKIHVTLKHTGKMEGMTSISTSCACNARCKRNAEIKGSICEKCYSFRMMKFRAGMAAAFERNYNLLTSSILPAEDLPVINAKYCRIESFGDIANWIQAANYLNIIRKNPDVKFAWWTKNPDLIKEALFKTRTTKPDNVQIVLSSLFVNKKRVTRYNFIDKVFTVYDKQTAEEKHIDINCGARHCMSCLKCYEKNMFIEINELLK